MRDNGDPQPQPAAARGRLRGELQHTGYVREPTVVGNLLTRRLTLTARIEAGTPQTAITVAETALLTHLRGHGAEYRLVGIQHATPTCSSHRRTPS